MNKNSDSIFLSYENQSSRYYPSLTSPMKSLFIEKSLLSPFPNVFDRLQADTEMRMRSRLDSFSASRSFKSRANTPNQDIFRQQSRIHNSKSSNSFRLDKNHSNDFNFRPTINPTSELILKNKYLGKAKISRSRQYLYDDEEYSKPADIEEIKPQKNKVSKEVYKEHQKVSNTINRNSTNNIVNSIQQQVNNEEHKVNSKIEINSVTDRKYIPMFTKPFDISKFITKSKCVQPKHNIKSYSKIDQKNTKKVEIRPLLRPISESNLTIEEGYIYKQLVKDRVQRQFTSGKK